MPSVLFTGKRHLLTADEPGQPVTVLPITHSPPANPRLAVEIPQATKRRLGLDDACSWVVLDRQTLRDCVIRYNA